MAVHPGKIAILVGAGVVVGSILAKEDSLTSVSSLFSGAFKGWKLPEMFVTRRSLADACDTIAKQLEGVYSSLPVNRRHLSSRMEQLDISLDEVADLTVSTRDTITGIASEVETMHAYVALLQEAVEIIQSKGSRIEVNRDISNNGVVELSDFAYSRIPQPIQASSSSSSRPAIEPANFTPPREMNGGSNGRRGVFGLLSGFGSVVFTRSQSLSTAAVRAPTMVIYCLAILLIWLWLYNFSAVYN